MTAFDAGLILLGFMAGLLVHWLMGVVAEFLESLH